MSQPGVPDLVSLVRPGDTIAWGGSAAEPAALLRLLDGALERMPRARVLIGYGLADSLDGERLSRHLQVTVLGGAGSNRRLAEPGRLDVLPANYSTLPELVRRGDVAVDVALVQLAADGSGQRHTLLCDYMVDAVARARVVVAEINDRAPCVAGEPPVPDDDLDHVLRVSHPLVQWQAPDGGGVARAIGEHAARLIPDGATLQVGLGTLPDAVLACLGKKRDLGVHSGVVGDRIADLCACGVITNRRKRVDPGLVVTGGLLGTDRVYRWAHRNPGLRLRASRYTHALGTLSGIENLHGINSALEVDLTGQINAEVADGRHVGLIGGQSDFLRGCLCSPGGRGIVALASTARGGSVSRIVASLSGGIVTTARADADVVVTEYGVAELRGRTVLERARALIAVAHPDFRARLEAAAQRLV